MNETNQANAEENNDTIQRLIRGVTAVRITEISALITVMAFLCGVAYDASYLYSFQPNLFNLLSINDHLVSAVRFLPIIIMTGGVSQLMYVLLVDPDTRYDLITAISTILPGKSRERIVSIIADYKAKRSRDLAVAKFPTLSDFGSLDEARDYLDKQKKSINIVITRITLSLMIVTPFVYISFALIPPPWTIIAVLLAMIWWVVLVAFSALKSNFGFKIDHRNLIFVNVILYTILTIPVIVGLSSLWGFIDAVRLQVTHEKGAILYTNGNPPNDRSVLMRIIDGGVLLYNQPLHHVSYYPWRAIEHLEVRHR